MRYKLVRARLDDTFAHFRTCGAGRRECQVLWVSRWSDPGLITDVVHPIHKAHARGFEVDGPWLGAFWNWLAANGKGIRAQVHTHPGAAFHSAVDDAYPIIHHAGFLSLVVPRFALGPVGLQESYLAELQLDGSWIEVDAHARLEVVE